jgi:hypothetical protein
MANAPALRAEVVHAAIDLDKAIANAVVLLEKAPSDELRHAARWLQEAYFTLDRVATLEQAELDGRQPTAPLPLLHPLAGPGRAAPPPRTWTTPADQAWLREHIRGRAVELGTAAGASAAAMENVDELTCVDTWHTPGGAADPDYPDRFEEFMANLRQMPHRDRISVLRANTIDAARSFPDGSLDAVFIDADHTDLAVAADIAAWLPKLKPGALLCGHDYGHPKFPGVKLAVDTAFPLGVELADTIWHTRAPSLFQETPQ